MNPADVIASIHPRRRREVVGMSMALAMVLFIVRALILGYGSWRPVESWWRDGGLMVAAGIYDCLFVVGLGVVFWGWLELRPGWGRAVVVVFRLLALVTLGLALVNIQFVYMVGRPFNYQWLYYSDFMRSTDSHLAVRDSLSWLGLLLAGVAVVVLFGVARLVSWGLGRLPRRKSIGIAAVTGAVYFSGSAWFLRHHPEDHHRLANCVVVFVSSVLQEDSPSLFTMKTPVGPEDFQTGPPPPPARIPAIRNVILFVMESVPAQYLETYGGVYPVTAELTRYRPQSLLFRNIYAHTPATDKSLVALLCAQYPWISYRSMTHEYPAIALPSLSSELRRHGFRTAFFNCSDNRFHKLGEFLAHRGFDKVVDWRDLSDRTSPFVASDKDWQFLDGSDGLGTVELLKRWIDEQPDRPFFGMVWTMMTHHPYFSMGPEYDFGVNNPPFNRYLNGLRHTDKVLGELLRALAVRGLAESTLVIVTGDHGEAFGQHGQKLHAGRLYEENLHVPLLLINPRLFHGEEDPVVGGLMDIAPTTLDLLGLPAPALWQGRSLLAGHRSPRVYFFTPWSDYWFGYREGDRKYIFNASANECEIYDLRTDPHEQYNLAGQSPENIVIVQQRLAAWVQYQDRLIKKVVAEAED